MHPSVSLTAAILLGKPVAHLESIHAVALLPNEYLPTGHIWQLKVALISPSENEIEPAGHTLSTHANIAPPVD